MKLLDLLPWGLLALSWAFFLGRSGRKAKPDEPVEKTQRIKCSRFSDCGAYADPLCGSSQCARCCWWYCNNKCGKGQKKAVPPTCVNCGAHDGYKCAYCGKKAA